jgi:phage FluMu protein Com
MLETFRCTKCDKKLFEANLRLLMEKRFTPQGEKPRIEHQCPRCKHLNVFTYDPASYVAK